MNDAAGTGIGSWVTTAGLAGVPGPDLLRGFTAITDSAAPEAIISAIHATGGDVLKLIGDGTLAILTADAPATACRRALEAERLAGERIAALNERRAADGLPLTQACPGLHLGEVFHGDIGSQERLDFTVIGPAVDEASRIAAMCRSADRAVLLSSAFAAAAADADRALFVPVGRYALRGVCRPQEPFTLEPPADRPEHRG